MALIQDTYADDNSLVQSPKSFSSRRSVSAVPSSGTMPTIALDTDDDSQSAIETNLDEDSTIVSSARSLNYCEGEFSSNKDYESPSESTIEFNNSCLSNLSLNDSVSSNNELSPELSYQDYYGETEDDGQSHQPNESTNRAKQIEKKLTLDAALRALPPQVDLQPNLPGRKTKSSRRLSLSDLGKFVGKSYRSSKSLGQTGKNRRRLSFVGAVEQKFDNTAPASQMTQDTWSNPNYKKSTRFAATCGEGGVTTNPQSPKKPQKRLKSALKFFPRFGRSRRRASWLAGSGDGGAAGGEHAPKLPGRSTSFRPDDDISSSGSNGDEDIVIHYPTHRVLAKNHHEVRWGASHSQQGTAPPSMPRQQRRRNSLLSSIGFGKNIRQDSLDNLSSDGTHFGSSTFSHDSPEAKENSNRVHSSNETTASGPRVTKRQADRNGRRHSLF